MVAALHRLNREALDERLQRLVTQAAADAIQPHGTVDAIQPVGFLHSGIAADRKLPGS